MLVASVLWLVRLSDSSSHHSPFGIGIGASQPMFCVSSNQPFSVKTPTTTDRFSGPVEFSSANDRRVSAGALALPISSSALEMGQTHNTKPAENETRHVLHGSYHNMGYGGRNS